MAERNTNQARSTQDDQLIEYSGPLRRSEELQHAKGVFRLHTVTAVLTALSCLAAVLLLAVLYSPHISAGASGVLRWGRALGWLLLLLAPLHYAATRWLVLNPLRTFTELIHARKRLPGRGGAELRMLARGCNAVLEEYLRTCEELRYKAEHDALTGLYNRGAYEQLLASHQADGNIALLWVDVDCFKNFNDQYGHDTGDKVLQKVAQTLRRGFRASDYVCRTGGDEFAVIMVNITNRQQTVVLRRAQAVQNELRTSKDELPPVTLSIGAAFSEQCGPEDSLFKMADQALYRVKEAGRDGCAFYGEEKTYR